MPICVELFWPRETCCVLLVAVDILHTKLYILQGRRSRKLGRQHSKRWYLQVLGWPAFLGLRLHSVFAACWILYPARCQTGWECHLHRGAQSPPAPLSWFACQTTCFHQWNFPLAWGKTKIVEWCREAMASLSLEMFTTGVQGTPSSLIWLDWRPSNFLFYVVAWEESFICLICFILWWVGLVPGQGVRLCPIHGWWGRAVGKQGMLLSKMSGFRAVAHGHGLFLTWGCALPCAHPPPPWPHTGLTLPWCCTPPPSYPSSSPEDMLRHTSVIPTSLQVLFCLWKSKMRREAKDGGSICNWKR